MTSDQPPGGLGLLGVRPEPVAPFDPSTHVPGVRIPSADAWSDARLAALQNRAYEMDRDLERFDAVYDTFNLERSILDEIADEARPAPGNGKGYHSATMQRFEDEAQAIADRLSFPENVDFIGERLGESRAWLSDRAADAELNARRAHAKRRIEETTAQLTSGFLNDPVERGRATTLVGDLLAASRLPEPERRMLQADFDARLIRWGEQLASQVSPGTAAPDLPLPMPQQVTAGIADPRAAVPAPAPAFELSAGTAAPEMPPAFAVRSFDGHEVLDARASMPYAGVPLDEDLYRSAVSSAAATDPDSPALQGLTDLEQSNELATRFKSLLEQTRGRSEQEVRAAAAIAGLDGDMLWATARVLDARPDTYDAVEAEILRAVPRDYRLRNLLLRELDAIAASGADPARRARAEHALSGELSWLLDDPSVDPRVRGQLADMEALYLAAAAHGEGGDSETALRLGEYVLSILPISGEVMSAYDAYLAFSAAYQAFSEGRTADGLWSVLEGVVSTAGAVPLGGTGLRVTRRLFDMLNGAARRMGERVADTARVHMPDVAVTPEGMVLPMAPSGRGSGRGGGRGSSRRGRDRENLLPEPSGYYEDPGFNVWLTREQFAAAPKGPGWREDRAFYTGERVSSSMLSKERVYADPQRIRTTQPGFTEEFGHPVTIQTNNGPVSAATIDELVQHFQSGRITEVELKRNTQPLDVLIVDDKLFSLDHRRLVAFRRMGIDVPIRIRRVEDLYDLSSRERDRLLEADLTNNGVAIYNRDRKVWE